MSKLDRMISGQVLHVFVMLMVGSSILLLVTGEKERRDASEAEEEGEMECLYTHPQTQYCLSDFVIRGTVEKLLVASLDNSTGEWTQKAKVRWQRVYKNPTPHMQWPNRKMLKIWINTEKPLQKGVSYLVAGSQWAKSLKSQRCDWTVEWSEVSRMQYRGIQGRYSQNCQCLIKSDCLTVSGRNICNEQNKVFEFTNNHFKRSITDGGWDDEQIEDELWGYYPTEATTQENPFSCPVEALEGSRTKMGCFAQHAGCYMTKSGNSCRWRTDDDYYAFCVNKDWLQK